MKIKIISKPHALTLIEVLVVLVAIIIIAAVFLYPHKPKYPAVVCITNMRQISSALMSYAGEHNDKFPFQVSVTNGGTMELVSNNAVYPHFQILSNYLSDPKILICPYDKEREPAKSIATLNDNNISYFLNLDAVRDSTTNSILAGDRFLQVNGQTVKPGLFVVTANLNISWTPNVHQGGGNILWSDGSSQQTRSPGLPNFIGSQPLATNRFLMP